MTSLNPPVPFPGKQRFSLKDFTAQNKKVLAAIAIGLLVLVVAAAVSWRRPKETGLPAEEQWQEYSSDALGFSVSYPAGWQVTEEAAESGPDILIADGKGLAFVRIRGLFDPYLNSAEAIASSVAKYQTTLASQPGMSISKFQPEDVQGGIGGFMATGGLSINGTPYRFQERGRLSTRGQVLIMRAADEAGAFIASLDTLEAILDSFTLK